MLGINYYVSNNGNNSNSGTSISLPWLSIQYAVDQISPNDTIFVLDGTYNENIQLLSSGNLNGFKTLMSYNQWGAKIINSQNYYTDAIYVHSNFWNIIGFEIYHNNLNVDAYGHGIYVFEASHVGIKNNKIHDNGGSGIQYGIFDYATIEGNICYNNANYNPFQCSGISLYQALASDDFSGYHNKISNNTCYNNLNITTDGFETTDGNGIIIDDFQNTQGTNFNPRYRHKTLVDNNLCYRNGGKGLHSFFSDNVHFYNNTAYHNNFDTVNTGTFRAELSNAFSNNCIWRNNIGVANPGAGILSYNNSFLVGYSDTVIFENNLTYNGEDGNPSVYFNNSSLSLLDFSNDNNLFGVNPFFQAPENDNFELQELSPCINSGNDSIVSFIDLNNNIRVSGSIDMGCFEYSQNLSLEHLEVNGDFNIFPNPTTSVIFIETNLGKTENLVIKDSQGKLIHEQKINKNLEQIDLSNLNSGFYCIEIISEKKVARKTFIKK